MGKKKQVAEEDLIIPPQDGKICGTICICQMTFVLSLVALVYLTVAIYMPATRAFESGVIDTPVMCTTTRAWQRDSCEWVSCSEWCLSKGTGACLQIYVNLRHNGSSLLFGNCTNSANKTCYGLDQENAKKFECIKDHCKNLTGIFNCTAGDCYNITDAFECVFHNSDPPLKCSGRRGKVTCMDIGGLYSCQRGACNKIKQPYNCDRRCIDIPTRNKNVILLNGDKVYLSKCSSAYDIKAQQEVWNDTENNIIMSSCFAITNTTNGIEATDCINGSILEQGELEDLTNFTYLSFLHYSKSFPVKTIAPAEADLSISNESGLMINLEGCVNTLKDECKEFTRVYGKDGSDHNARARFACYYSENKIEKSYVRFDLDTEYKQFLFALLLPSILLVVSCFVLILCQKSVVVGNDAKMRFKCTGGQAFADSGIPNSSSNGEAVGAEAL